MVCAEFRAAGFRALGLVLCRLSLVETLNRMGAAISQRVGPARVASLLGFKSLWFRF